MWGTNIQILAIQPQIFLSSTLSKTFDGLLNTPIKLFYFIGLLTCCKTGFNLVLPVKYAFVASFSVNKGKNVTQKRQKNQKVNRRVSPQSLTWQQIKCWTLISTSQLVVSFYLVLPAACIAAWSTLGIRRTRIWSI